MRLRISVPGFATNRTNLELKLCGEPAEMSELTATNRTNLELKLGEYGTERNRPHYQSYQSGIETP